MWKSKMEALRSVIPLMDLMKELNGQGFTTTEPILMIFFKVYENNSGALEITTVFKL
jgi:hypothetical protein